MQLGIWNIINFLFVEIRKHGFKQGLKMKNKIIFAIFASLLAMGMATQVSASTINVSFSGNGNSIDYVFESQEGLVEVGGPFAFISATYNVGGSSTRYDASNANLVLDEGEVLFFEIRENDGSNALINQMVFNGYLNNAGGFFGLNYYGDAIAPYTMSDNYSFSSLDEILYYSGGPTPFGDLGMTSVNVSTVSAVPVPAAIWLFASGLLGLAGVSRRQKC